MRQLHQFMLGLHQIGQGNLAGLDFFTLLTSWPGFHTYIIASFLPLRVTSWQSKLALLSPFSLPEIVCCFFQYRHIN